MRVLTYTADAAWAQLGQFLRQRGFSRAMLVALKQAPGSVLCNGRPVYLSAPVRAGDDIRVTLADEAPSAHLPAAALPLSIVYEDEDVLIVNKPAGMPVHPSHGHTADTLGNALAHRYRAQPFVFRPVNRLDRDTTGLVVVARHQLAAAVLARQVKEKTLRRHYLAVAAGRCPEEGVICAPIARAAGSVIERTVDYTRGEWSRTHFRRLDWRQPYSLLHLTLESGRTHQIRVHLRHIGHPIPGDFLYHPDFTHFSHQALHAWRVELTHPVTGRRLHVCAPPPEEMAAVFPDCPAQDK